ncbi:hypothetical protein [Psychromonas algicola]|uniref:hypothetical protein n=1 Tax=Psychromonas algicola TaxID=2555642 RepID=UPI0010685732|nr:hypothetical protein [Psychromonas sp. RZ5]TEW44082.1 hypothetical protein E2R67_15270 [Psychromonas sp. RZ5]
MEEQENKTRMENVIAVCKDCLGEFKNEKLTTKERALYIFFSPITFVVAVFFALLGLDRFAAQIAGVIVAIFSMLALLIYCALHFGPAVLAWLNMVVNG